MTGSKQIKKSVTNATKNHPRLREYVVVAPLDRSKKEVASWKSLLHQLGHPTKRRKKAPTRRKLTWWGKSEVVDLLTRAEHHGRTFYWFGCPTFNDAWLDAQNALARACLDTRYTPTQHVKTDAEVYLDAFSLTDAFVANYYRVARRVLKALDETPITLRDPYVDEEFTKRRECLAATWTRCRPFLGDGKRSPRLKGVHEAMDQLAAAASAVYDRLLKLDDTERSKIDENHRRWAETPYSYVRNQTSRLCDRIFELIEFTRRFECADYNKLLVLGSAGTGKSHLLANTVEKARERGEVALLVIGEQFRGGQDPWSQLRGVVGWEASTVELLTALNHRAESTGRPGLLCIDALNESVDRGLWKSHLLGFANRIDAYPYLRLVVRCRTDFCPITLPPSLVGQQTTSWQTITHHGFGDELFHAVVTYFNGYNVQSDHFPPLLQEFANPLFLKTVCEAFQNSRLPKGTLSLKAIMDRRIQKVCDKLLVDIDCAPDLTRQAIQRAAAEISSNSGLGVARDIMRASIDSLLPGRGESASLYRHLRSNGVLVEVVTHQPNESEPIVVVRFPFERFSEYFIADRLVGNPKGFDALKRQWTKDGTLKKLNDYRAAWRNSGLLAALAIVLPERLKVELPDVITEPRLQRLVLAAFRDSLPWRSAASFGRRTRKPFILAQQFGFGEFLETLVTIATIPEHPYNADFLHRKLMAMELPRRELLWTIELSKLTVFQGGGSVPDRLVAWAFTVPLNLISNEQALLIGKLLLWFCSSNHRGFRFRATLAAIRILQGRCIEVCELLAAFKNCNDPYVCERLFAVAAGVAMRESNPDRLKKLAEVVHHQIFGGKTVVPNILIRDYARSVLEFAHHRKCLPVDISVTSFRPPYRSRWPKVWSESAVEKFAKKDGWREIKWSVKPEPGGYGDFGRYAMQSAVHHFSSVPLAKPYPQKERNHFDAWMARRWVLQRIKQLRWTPEKFGTYEQHLPCRGRQTSRIEEVRVERISKKYQWIALHELLGYLSDHYHVALDFREESPTPFLGAWELWCRDFDPTQPLLDLTDDEEESDGEPRRRDKFWWNRYPDPFADDSKCGDLAGWVNTDEIADFRSLIDVGTSPGSPKSLLALCWYDSWDEPRPFETKEVDQGYLRMWAHARSWLVERSKLPLLLDQLKSVHFWGEGCQLTGTGKGWLGEYPWAPSHGGFSGHCFGHDGWLKTVRVPVVQTVCEFSSSTASADIPTPQMLAVLNAKWLGKDFEFASPDGQVVAYSPLARKGRGTQPCLIGRDYLIAQLERANMSIVWTVLGGRSCWDGHQHVTGSEGEFSAVYYLDGRKIEGGITKHVITRIPLR